ncbi:streptophobe family protein [Kitasatospora sp. NPDC059463]|uniref:streptophobe family protein n=1 Tax=unclassified Kitasatospora TaxID=2633591 RepID=UPI0036BF7B66
MHQQARPGRPAGSTAAGPRGPLRGWPDAVAVVLAGLVAMAVVAALGLWAAGADTLPGGGFPSVLAATLALAVGGSVDLDGGAGFFASADARITAMPLSVGLAGALTVAEVFLRQLRHRAVVGGRELLGRTARTAVVWLVALALLCAAARHTFTVPLGDGLAEQLGGVLGLRPDVGFRADPVTTLGLGLLWLLVVLAATFAVSRRAPLPPSLVPLHQAVRPAAFAMLLVLLGYVALGVVAAIGTAAVNGGARQVAAVALLALPNLVWLAFGVGLGGEWHGHLVGAIGLPVPKPLAAVLRTGEGQDGTVSLGTLADQDARAWWLLPLAAVLMLAAGVLAAHRSPRDVRPRQHAVRLAAAAAVTVLLVGVWTRVSADYGLSVLGVGLGEGGLGDLLSTVLGPVAGPAGPAAALAGGTLTLDPVLWTLVPLAAGWGLLAGFLGALAATRLPRRGEAG